MPFTKSSIFQMVKTGPDDNDDNVVLSIYVLSSLVSFAIAFIVIKNIIHDASELIIDTS
jgi:hypothetical protein